MSSSNIKNNNNDADLRGVSVHWLKTGFMDEVKEFHARRNWFSMLFRSPKSLKVYEIENLEDESPGMIRNKSKNKISSIDDNKGASYVDCLEGEDNVGKATVMLSYTWGYTIGMIVDTLVDWCKTNGKDLKRTYVWICCLCVNQHRVAENKKSGITTSTEVFFKEFGDRVSNIGTILALMEPWDAPKYLTRIWCVFEVYWAKINNCNVEIIIPKDQKGLMATAILRGSKDINKLYEVLSNIDVQKADASVEEDKIKILAMIDQDIGFITLNNGVNELFRQWVRKKIYEIVEKKSKEIHKNNTTESSILLSFAKLCYNVGCIFYHNGELDESLKMYNKSLEICKEVLGEEHKEVAAVYNNIGTVLNTQGDYGGALIQYKKCLKIELSVLGENHPDAATSYKNIGLVLDNKGDYDDALIQYNKCLKIEKSVLGENHPDVATSYNNIGASFYNKGNYDAALVEFCKALEIYKSALGDDHPDTKDTAGWIECIKDEMKKTKEQHKLK